MNSSGEENKKSFSATRFSYCSRENPTNVCAIHLHLMHFTPRILCHHFICRRSENFDGYTLYGDYADTTSETGESSKCCRP